ncbi:MAG: sodium:solute symporter [Candidatus Scalinduaceae bacterium]
MNGISISIIIFLTVSFGLGIYAVFQVRGKTRRFIICGKALPLWLVALMLTAQSMDANAGVGNVFLVATGGFWAGATIPIGLALCLFMVGIFFAKPLNSMNLLTLPDFYFRRYDRTTNFMASVAMLFSFIILVAGNIAGAAFLMSYAFGWEYVTGLWIITTILILYSFGGGLYSCAYTDLVQISLAVIGSLMAFIWLQAHFGHGFLWSNVPTNFYDLSGLTKAGDGALINWAAIAALGLGDIIALDFMERVFASKTPETARRGCYIGGAFTLIAGIPLSFLGLWYLSIFPDMSPERTALPHVATEIFPVVIGAFMFCGIIGAGMSTANGGIVATGTVFARNIIQKCFPGRVLKDSTQLILARSMTFPMMGAAFLFAWIRPDPGMLLILAFDVVFAGCLVPLVAGIYWKGSNSVGAIACIAVGSILRLVLYYTVPEHLAGIDTLIPPVVGAAVFFPVCYFTNKRIKPKHHVITETPTDDEVIEGLKY